MEIKNDSYVFGMNTFGRDKGRNGVDIKTPAFHILSFNPNDISKC